MTNQPPAGQWGPWQARQPGGQPLPPAAFGQANQWPPPQPAPSAPPPHSPQPPVRPRTAGKLVVLAGGAVVLTVALVLGVIFVPGLFRQGGQAGEYVGFQPPEPAADSFPSPTKLGWGVSVAGDLVSIASVRSGEVMVSTQSQLARVSLNTGAAVWTKDAEGAHLDGQWWNDYLVAQSGSTVRLLSVDTGELLNEGSASGRAVHCGSEILVVDASRTATYDPSDLTRPKFTSTAGYVWPDDALLICNQNDYASWVYDDWPQFQVWVDRDEDAGSATAGLNSSGMSIYFGEQEVRISKGDERLQLPIPGVTGGARIDDQVAVLYSEQALTGVDLQSLEVAWETAEAGIRRVAATETELYAFSDTAAYTIDPATGKLSQVAAGDPTTMWVFDAVGRLCSVDGGEQTAKGRYVSSGPLKIACQGRAGAEGWTYETAGPASLAVQFGVFAIGYDGKTVVFQ